MDEPESLALERCRGIRWRTWDGRNPARPRYLPRGVQPPSPIRAIESKAGLRSKPCVRPSAWPY